MANKDIVRTAFEQWRDGKAYISDIFSDDLRWTIVGQSLASKTYEGKQAFIDEVLHPFAQRFSSPFRPTVITGVYADGDVVVAMWDGEGKANDGAPYRNTYAWFMTLKDGLVVEGVAFYDSIAFNDLWTRVAPRS
jgi:uncharacterized protein